MLYKFIIIIIVGYIPIPVIANIASDSDINYYSAENIQRFAEHLFQEKDYLRAAREYERYLSVSSEGTDNTLYKISLCYYLAGNTEKAISFSNRIIENPESPLRPAAYYRIAYSYFISDRYDESIQFLDRALREVKNSDEQGKFRILKSLNYMHQKRWRDADTMLGSVPSNVLPEITSDIKSRAIEGANLPYKSPFLAAMLSFIVPGTGKIYCRQYGDGVYSFILITASGLLAWDGFRENGTRSIKGWLFGSVGTIFYIGNIYGSNIAARVYNRQLEINLLRRLPVLPVNFQ